MAARGPSQWLSQRIREDHVIKIGRDQAIGRPSDTSLQNVSNLLGCRAPLLVRSARLSSDAGKITTEFARLVEKKREYRRRVRMDLSYLLLLTQHEVLEMMET